MIKSNLSPVVFDSPLLLSNSIKGNSIIFKLFNFASTNNLIK